MADIQANIGIGVDTSQALAAIRQLQREISAFHTSMAKGGALASANSARLSQNLVNTINATGQFSAGMTRIQSGTESFTNALEKNKLSMSQYFRFAGGASRSFGKMFSKEFSTINQVATERVKDLQTQYISMGRDASGALQAIKVRPLALDMDNLGTRVQMVAQKQQLFNQLLKQGSTNLLNFGKNTQWAGRQLMVGFTIPLTIFGGIAIKEFQKIEDQVVKFRRVYGDMFNTDADTEKALSNVRELAEEFTKYGIAVEKTIGLAAKVAQMGNVGTDLTEQVTQATRLAVLGGLEQEEALETTISLTNAFGIAAEDLAEKIAFLNAAENQTILAIEDFNTAIPLSGSVVRQLGGDVEDLAVLLTAMREGGINASQAGNALKSSLGRLIAPSRNAKETLSGFGIDVMGIVEQNAGNLMGTINTLAVSLNELDPLSRARSIEALFGKFQFARMSTLFSNIIRDGSQTSKVLGLAANSAAELSIIAERELKAVEESPAFKLQKQMEALKASLAPIGEEFVKAIGPLIEFGTRLLKSFNNLGEGGKQFVVILTSLAGVVAPAVLMVVGLVANGIANLVKFVALLGRGFARLSGSSKILGTGTAYMTQEQIEAATVAASLGQSHSRLIQVFTAETTAVRNLAAAYRQAIVAQSGFRGAGMRGQAPGPVPKKYNKGVTMVPGPKGAGDIIPAMLSPGEAVIPATQAQKYSGFIQNIISDNVPGYRRGVFLGMPKSSKQVKSEREASGLIASRYVKDPKVPVTDYGHQIAPTTGRSFPISGVGGAYAKADGSKVFVKPFVDKQSAVAEMRAGQIARDVHGLLAPKHTLVQMRDPTDRSGKRLFYALESKLDPTFANPTGRFTKGQMVKQLLASLVRADKDLSPGNMYGRVLTDPGPGGVYSRASGYRNMAKPGELPSLAQQAEINLLGVKGGARKFFAQSTSDIARSMTPKEYQQMMLKEINTTLPKLRKTIDSFNLTGPEKLIYEDMLTRLEAGKNVDWTQFHTMHSNVPALPAAPMRLADGILSVPGPKGAGDVVPAMLSPGEAVIPAKQSRKHLSLIKGIVADNVPGYSSGTAEILGKNIRTDTNFDALNRLANRLNSISTMIPGILNDFTKSLVDGGKMAASTMKTKLNELAEEQRRIIAMAEYTEAGGGSGAQTGMVGGHTGAKTQVDQPTASKLAGSLKEGHETRKIMEASDGGTLHSEMVLGITAQENAHKGGTEELSLLTGKERAKFYRDPENQKMAGSYLEDGGYIDLEDPVQEADFTLFTSLLADKLEAAGERAISEVEYADMVSQARSELPDRFDADGNAIGVKAGIQRAENTYKTFTPSGADKKRYNLPAGEAFVQDPSTGQISHSTDVPGGSYQQRGAKLRPQFANQAEVASLENVRGAAESQGYDTAEIESLIQEARSAGADTGQGVIDGYSDTMQISSPSKRMFGLGKNAADSLADGFEQGMADETGKPPLPGNLAAPKAPTPPPMAPPSRAARMRDAILDSGPGKFVGKKLAQASGNAVTDSKGNVFYDPNEDPNNVFGQMEAKQKAFKAKLPGGSDYSPDLPNVAGGAPLPVRVVDGFEMDPQFQETMERGQIQTEDLSKTLGKNVETTEQNTKTTKEIEKTDKRQRRMGAAGKTLGALGGLTMAAGMATQAPGVIGETAQKLVGPLGALTAIAPMLIGLGPVLGSLVAVIALVVAGFFMYNKAMKDAARETYELQRAMGSSREAIQSFAEFSGRVTQTEIFKKQQEERFNPFQIAAAKTTFGENFAEDEAGQTLVENIRTSLVDLGKDQTVNSVFLQLGQAVGEGALSIPEARSIATELGDQLGDMSFGIEVNANLMRLLGPGGEDLTAGDRLTILADIREDRQRSRAEMDLEYRPTGYGEAFVSEMDKRTQMENEAGGIFGIGAILNPDYWASYFKSFTGIAAAEENMAQLSTILAQGVNDADAFAADMAAIEASYSESLAKAYSMDDEYEIDRLEAERKDAQDKVLKDRGQAQQQVLAELTKDTGKARIAMTEALKVDFADDQAALNQYTDALKQIQGLGLEDTKSLELEYMLTSGDMPFQTAMAIVENYETLPAVSTKIMEIQTNFGDLSGEASGLFNIFKGIDEGLAEEFVLQLDTTDLAEYQRQIEAFGAISRIQGLFPEGEEILLDVALKDPTVLDRILENISKLEGVDNSQITLDFIASTFGDEALAAAEAIWSDIPTADRKDALYSILTALDLDLGEGYDELFESLKGQTIAGVKIEKPGDILSLIGARTAGVAAGNRDLDTGPKETPTGSGAEPQVDSLIKKLRDLRLATIDMKKGWSGMQQALESVFAGGTKGINVFEGLSNQIRRMGVGENLIEMIVGMDPDEYNKRKNELFIFDAAGNIVGTTAKLKNMNSAFNAIAIGEYINSQQSFIEKTKNQISSISILTANGMSLAEAYQLVQDEALAAAIAMGATREEIEEIIRITGIAKQQREAMEEQQERSRISESVRKTNEEFRNQVNVLNQLSKAQGKYTDAQIGAIMNDKDLQKLFLNPSIDPKALEEALRNAENQANLNVQIALQTKSGQLEQFAQLQSDVNDYFAKEEAVINIDFEVATADDSKIVEDAQRQIADIQYKLDDYNAELEQISWVEDDINEKYDKRAEALDEIAKTNERIANQQKSQLDIADALSRGDIAAAARATAELRSQQVQDAQVTQKDMLDKQRERELSLVTGPGGQTREQLEAAITELERKLFSIEEELLEPAQERIRLAEVTRDLAIEQLELNGMNRLQFDEIAASTNLAAVNMEDMLMSARKLAALGNFIQTGEKSADWEELFPTPGARPAPSSGGGGGGGGGSSPAPAQSSTNINKGSGSGDTEYMKFVQANPTVNIGNSRGPAVPASQSAASKIFVDGSMSANLKPSTKPAYVPATSTAKAIQVISPPSKTGLIPSPQQSNVRTIVNNSSLSNKAFASEVARDDRLAARYKPPPPPPKKKFNLFDPSTWNSGGMIIPKRMAVGGVINRPFSPAPLQMAMGGKVMGYAAGGFSMGSDIVPAMLTPGEFVVRKRAVQNFGMENLEKINSGTYNDGSVYNYNLAVNVKSNSDPSRIARAVITQIKQIDNQRIRSNRI